MIDTNSKLVQESIFIKIDMTLLPGRAIYAAFNTDNYVLHDNSRIGNKIYIILSFSWKKNMSCQDFINDTEQLCCCQFWQFTETRLTFQMSNTWKVAIKTYVNLTLISKYIYYVYFFPISNIWNNNSFFCNFLNNIFFAK